MTASDGPFAGLRVFDFSRVLAGPICGQYLADLGADVVKVEPPSGDENRRWEPFVDGESLNFQVYNRGKRALTLDLKTERGQEVLRRLVGHADVLIESFLPDVAQRLGMGHETLAALNPDLVHVSIGAFGHDGDLRNERGYDLVMQAFTGHMMVTGSEGDPPVRVGGSVIDIATGMLAFGGAASALYARAAGRARGEHVRASLLQTGIGLMGYHITNYTVGGIEPQRHGSGVWSHVPYRAFPVVDGHVLIGVTNEKTWRRLCQALALADLGADRSLDGAGERLARRGEIESAITAAIAQMTKADAVKLLTDGGVPCSPVHTVAEAADHPAVRQAGMLVDVPTDDGSTRAMLGPAIRFGSEYPPSLVPSPAVGQHRAAVLSELGYSPEEVDALIETGTV